MRAWDNWNSYLNNDGNLLHGKIRFCRKGTTENVVIYDRDGQPIRNPEFTDILGRTEYQVFLEEKSDVTAYFYQYIGTGDMMQWQGEDYDPSRWSYQYSSDDTNPITRIDLETTTAEGVATMEDLRAKNPDEVPTVNGVKMLWLYGYYEAGDTSPVLYVWDPSSRANDDGGSVIMNNDIAGYGRWILASREFIFDVRHFGIFAQASKYSTDFSYTSQLSNCATYCVNEGLNAWFPDIPNATAYYLLDGSNTFSISGDIYCSDAVRFMCKSGTSGTVIQCAELHKAAPELFDSTVQGGSATLRADYINISWMGGNCTGDARIGWVIDGSAYPRTITGKEVHFETNGHSSLTLDNCQITSNKKITGEIIIQNSILKTEYFADDYDWSKLSSYNNTILLENCKDANTYIKLKNKQMESDYGDLGEQRIDAEVRAGGTIENCYGKIKVIQHGNIEMHNASLDITGLTATDNLNCVSCWLTVPSSCVVGSIQMRRGALGYSGANAATVQILQQSMFDKSEINTPLTTLGANVDFTNCDINAHVSGDNIVLTNNQIYAEVEQRDRDGIINVQCSGNMFHNMRGYAIPARHYIHGVTVYSKVKGIWTHNGSTYNTVHWIRIDRTNLMFQDWAHEYTYAGNSEPYLSQWSGRNRPLCFKRYGGYWTSRATGTGIFSTTTIPFVFMNYRDRRVTVVPRYQYWKMFTVGRGWSSRSGHIQSGPMTIGIMEGDYNEHTNGQVAIHWTWGVNTSKNASLYDGKRFGYMHASCRDGDGEADYVWSFEAEDAVHGEYSYGCELGYYDSSDWDSGSDRTAFVTYPSTSNGQCILFIMIDPDFTTGTNPAELPA